MPKGWHHDSLRHRNARKLGKAGPVYKTQNVSRIKKIKEIYTQKNIIKSKNLKNIKKNNYVSKMRFNIPYEGRVERKVLNILYRYIDSEYWYSTTAIARALRDEREHVYSALEALNKRPRRYVLKTPGNPCLWKINPEKINEVRKIIRVSEPEQDFDEDDENYVQPIKQIGMPILKRILPTLISSTPIAREAYCAYLITDTLVSQWNMIEQYYNKFQSNGIVGIGKVLVKSMVSSAVSNIETKIIWSAIKDKIQPEYANAAESVLSSIIEDITDEEINYVEQQLG